MPDDLNPVPPGTGTAQPTGTQPNPQASGQPVTPAPEPPKPDFTTPLTPPTSNPIPSLVPDPTSVPPPEISGIPGGPESIIPPVISAGPPPSPPRTRAKIVGSILALLILVIGIPAGVFLISQQQELRERAAECPVGTTYTVSGTVRETTGRGVSNATICLDPQASGCTGGLFSTTTGSDGSYSIRNVTPGGAGHNVYLEPSTVTGATITSPNPQLVGGEVCEDARVVFVVSSTGGGAGDGGGGGACPAGSTYAISGKVTAQNGNPINRVYVCIDPPSSGGCNSARAVAQTNSDGFYRHPGITPGGDGHNVFLDPATLPSGYTVTSTNPQLVGGQVCVDTTVNFAARFPESGGDGGRRGDGRGGSTPTITAECRNIAFYDSTGGRLTQTELTQLKPGNTVKIAVLGSTNSGQIDKARFKINGTFNPNSSGTTTKDSTSGEFYINYQIPADVRTFNIEAQLHHTNPGVGDGGWF